MNQELTDAISNNEIKKFIEVATKSPSCIGKTDLDGMTVLLDAASLGRLEIVKFLIEKTSASISEKNIYGDTALILAASNGHLEVVQYLLKNTNSTLSEKNKHGFTPLLRAVYWGKISIVDFLLKNGSQITEAEEHGYTPIFVAIDQNQFEMLQYLLEKTNSKMDKIKGCGDTPLIFAASYGRINMIEFLLKNGYSKINETNHQQTTPLLIAVLSRKLQAIKYLLEHGSQITEKDQYGYTAFLTAVHRGHIEIADYLLKNTASKNYERKQKGYNALHIAAFNGNIEMAKYLIKINPNLLNERIECGNTPLLEATWQKHISMVDYFLQEAGSSYKERNENGDTALHMAAYQGELALVDKLLPYGFKINERNKQGNTAVHLAAIHNHIAVVDYLLTYTDFNIEDKNKENFTIFSIAKYKGHVELIQYLQKMYPQLQNDHENVLSVKEIHLHNLINYLNQGLNKFNLKFRQFSIEESISSLKGLGAILSKDEIGFDTKIFSECEFYSEFLLNGIIKISNKIFLKTLKSILKPYLKSTDFSKKEISAFLKENILKKLWSEYMASSKKGKKILNRTAILSTNQKETLEKLDILYVRITSSQRQLINYIADKNIPAILNKFKEKKEELSKEIDYCDNIMSVYTFKPEKERKKKPYLENNPKKREQLGELYLDALEMSKTALRVQELFEDLFRKKIGLVRKLVSDGKLEALEHIYDTKFNYYKKSIEEIYEKIFGLEEEFDIIENSLKGQREILDSLVNNINKIEQAKQRDQHAKKDKELKKLKEIDEKRTQEEQRKEEAAKRKEVRKQQLETYLANRKANSLSQNNSRFLRFMENSTQKNNLSNNHSMNNTETKHTKEAQERPRFKKETLEKAAQIGARLNMEPSLVRMKYILDNSFNQNKLDTLFIETKALLYLCAHIMENLKRNHTHSVFPIDVVYKFRNALYHNVSLFKGLLGDKIKIKEDNKAIREMVSILYNYFIKFQQEGTPAPKASDSSTFNLIINSEIPNTFKPDLCKKMLNHYGHELTEIRKQQTLYPGDEVLLVSARSFIEAQAGCIFAHYEDNYSSDSEFDLYKAQFGYCRSEGNKIRHGKTENPMRIKKVVQENLELTTKSLSLEQDEEDFPKLPDTGWKELKELKAPKGKPNALFCTLTARPRKQ